MVLIFFLILLFNKKIKNKPKNLHSFHHCFQHKNLLKQTKLLYIFNVMKINIGMGFKINNRLYFYIITKHYFVYKYKNNTIIWIWVWRERKTKNKNIGKKCLNKLWNVFVYVYNVIVISIIWCNIFIQAIDYILRSL